MIVAFFDPGDNENEEMNDATTGHKLQGMSKDKLIVVSWSFIANWIYVVLSRERTLKGLFFLKPTPCMSWKN